eukprot:TRINITY_DN2501_c0_g2_i5.p1 TRINITY_DN2501_c0_g2~~TRINITY_DN2501_c0_g2_i5.p1  ORF type:complete len:1231 (+),score=430.28 TRINITY_DN2501_c0_g2_i5:227-3919(+)
MKGTVESLLFWEESSSIVIITRSLLLSVLKFSEEGHIDQQLKVKVSITLPENGQLQAGWAGSGVLAISGADPYIRLFNIKEQSNMNLFLPDASRGEYLTSIDYNGSKQSIAGCTTSGALITWTYGSDAPTATCTDADQWITSQVTTLKGMIRKVIWGPGKSLLAATQQKTAFIFNEASMQHVMKDKVAVFQTSPTDLVINNQDALYGTMFLTTDIPVKGLDCNSKHVLVWNRKMCQSYAFAAGSTSLDSIAKWESPAMSISLENDQFYQVVDNNVEVCNLSGKVKQTLTFDPEHEGIPTIVNANGGLLAVATNKNILRLFDTSRKMVKAVGGIRPFESQLGDPLGIVESIAVNIDGTKVSCMASQIVGADQSRRPDSCIHILDVEKDIFDTYDFGNRVPISQVWDSVEAKLLNCETRLLKGVKSTSEEASSSSSGSTSIIADILLQELNKTQEESENVQNTLDVATLLVTSDGHVILQDSFAIDEEQYQGLVASHIPQLFFASVPQQVFGASSSTGQVSVVPQLKSKTMRDFVGMEDVDADTRDAMLNFSYYLTIGNMDEAYKTVRLIKSSTVWENMAQMCVKTNRLDVAEVCLSNMGHARGVRMLREARKDSEPEAQMAMVAVQLGMIEDAKRLYSACQRFDLLVQLHMANGDFEEAINVASKYDRIHLKNTYYAYAQHLEQQKMTAEAIKYYEKSDTHRDEVPRMLFKMGAIDELVAYISSSHDPKLLSWWAQYLESAADLQGALQFYEAAQDFAAVVRVLTRNGQASEALVVVNTTGDKAAAYQLARHLEDKDDIQNAIHLYTQADSFTHAIRLAKVHEYEDELLQLALRSSPSLQLDAAKHFEEIGSLENAIMLYQKGGNLSKALEISFRTGEHKALAKLADELDDNADPRLLEKVASFFVEHEEFEKAAQMFINAKNFDNALRTCLEHKVPITDEMTERMIIPSTGDEEQDNDEQLKLYVLIAKCYKSQKNYDLAAKYFTKADNKVKAVQCLIKTGDTKKIIFFANVSHEQQVYIVAAHFLQQCDWRNDKNVLKAIITFYTKARVPESLAAFYESAAQYEIDEYSEYEKALGALKEAVRHASKSKSDNMEQLVQMYSHKKSLVERFVRAQQCAQSDPEEMVKICEQLMMESDVESSVRVGDIYNQLIEHYHIQGDDKRAISLLDEMESKNITLDFYVNQELIDEIYQTEGRQTQAKSNQPMYGGIGGMGGFIDEDDIDEIEDEDY